MAKSFAGFASWRDVLDHVASGAPTYYQAPLDYRPVLVAAEPRSRGRVRVDPLSRDADPFTADHKHLDRFRREVSANPRKRPNPRGGNTRAERKSYIRATAWKDPDRAYELVRETARSDVELVDLYDAVAAIRSALEEEAEQRRRASEEGVYPPHGSTKEELARFRRIGQRTGRVARYNPSQNPRTNPGTERKSTLSTVSSWPGYSAALAATRKFHAADPTKATIIEIDDGKPGVTRKVVAGLGIAPETHYYTKMKGSNKNGYLWVHKNGEQGGKKPYLVLDPETGIVSMVGGTLKVTDWLHR